MDNNLPTQPRKRIDVLPTMREIIIAKQFPDEEMCVQMIVQKRWGREQKCPHDGCKGRFTLRKNKGNGWSMKCSRDPYHSISPFSGTMYASSLLPLLKWFEATDMLYRSNGMADKKMIAKRLGIGTVAAEKMRQKIIHALGITIESEKM